MSIRTKLLILLLLIAVLPLVAVSLFDLMTARELGRNLAEDRRRILTDNAFELMRSLVESYGRLLERDRRMLEHAVRLQAREVERRLAGRAAMDGPIYRNADYEGESPDVPGMIASPIHTRLNERGERVPLPVTYEQQVYFVVRGVQEQAIREDLRALSTMPQVYRYVRALNPDQMYWQYTSLESGFHTSYPGHGGYPAEYDPRVRPWYRKARERGDVSWILLPEVSTRTLSLTVATPVHRPGGEFAGVTAIDVPLTSLFAALELPPRWSREADAMLIAPGEQMGAEPGTAVVIARQDYAPGDEELDWRRPPELELLRADDPAQVERVMAEAAAGNAGVRRLTLEGESYLVAYGAGVVFPVVRIYEPALLDDVEQARQRVLSETRRRQVVSLVTLLVVVVAVTLIALRASRVVTRPARQLAAAAQRLADGDFDARVDVRGRDELARLGRVFNEVGPHLREREHIKHALAVAMDVQQNLLPSQTPSVPGLDVAGHSTYCDQTGGDYYDYLDLIGLDDRGVAVVVGDVMGHGVAAAMLMATARGILKSRCTAPGSLAELLTHLNRLLVKDTGGTRFMTMLLLVLDARTHSLRWASAGHDAPFIYDPARDEQVQLDGGGLPLGVREDETYEEYHYDDARPGLILFAATDGVWEMKGGGAHAGEMFGKDRVRALLRDHHDRSAEDISTILRRELASFRGDVAPDDDVTFVIVKVCGDEALSD